MCGIAGIYDFIARHPKELCLKEVARLINQQQYRGPDAKGLWSSNDDHCTLGHVRLSVVDLDPRSNQPMKNSNGRYTVVFNGEIYNYRELKSQLEARGIHFKTQSDTEVLIEGYAAFGKDLFSQLDGMFAFAIHDELTGEIVLGRDRAGEKPLYYATSNNMLVFSSEIKPLLASPMITAKLDEAGVFSYFALRYVPAPSTIVDTIKSLLPGTWLTFDRNGIASEGSYFAFDIYHDRPANNAEDLTDELEDLIVQSVEKRLIADVPVGAFLSSGIDSSLICAIAAERLNSNIRCFSAGFVGSKENETSAAQKIAGYLGLPFESYEVSESDLVQECSQFGRILDEPNGDRSCVPFFFLSRLVRSRVTVALSGDGGDELFGGYGRYLACRNLQDISRSEKPIDAVNSYLSNGLSVFALPALTQAFPNGAPHYYKHFLNTFAPAYLRPDLNVMNRLRITDFHSYLPGAVLNKVDRMSMRHSLEVRSPFLDREIIKLASKIPDTLCEKNGIQKIVLRNILARLLPHEFIRPEKQGFGMPPSFFQSNSKSFRYLYNQATDALSSSSFFSSRKQAFETLRMEAPKNINSYWAWIVLGLWLAELDDMF